MPIYSEKMKTEFFDKPSMSWEKWEEARKTWEKQAIPDQTITADELTEMIRNVVPGYHFDEEDREKAKAVGALRENAREAISRANYETRSSEARELGQQVFSGRRDRGMAFGMYIHRFMPEKEQTLRDIIAMTDKDEQLDAKVKLHREVMTHIADHSDEYLERCRNLDDEALVKNWPDIMTFSFCGDVSENLAMFPTRYTDEEKKYFFDKIVRLQPPAQDLGARIDMLAAPYSEKIDHRQILDMTENQLTALQDEMLKHQGMEHLNPFNEALSFVSMQRGNLTEKLRNDVFPGTDSTVIAMDLFGNVYSDFMNAIGDGLPVYVMSPDRPELEPTFAIASGGKTCVGDEALRQFAERPLQIQKPQKPVMPDASRKPSGFGGLWDSFCKSVGLESWRTAAAKSYEADMKAYEEGMKEYERKAADYEKLARLHSNLDIKAMTDSAKLKEARESMIQNRFGKSAEEYIRETVTARKAKEEEAARERAEAERKAKEEAILADKLKASGITKADLKTLNNIMKMAEHRYKGVCSALATELEELPADEKAKNLASAIANDSIVKQIGKGLQDFDEGKPLPENLKPMLAAMPKGDRNEISRFLTEQTKEMSERPEILAMAGRMSMDELRAALPEKTTVASAQKLAELKKEVLHPAAEGKNAAAAGKQKTVEAGKQKTGTIPVKGN